MAAPLSADVPTTFERISARVSVAVGAVQGERAASNSTILVGAEATMVVDTTVAPSLARAVRAEAERLGGRNVTYVLNTHGDPDHLLGNNEFPDAQVIAQRRVAELLGDPGTLAAYQKRLDALGDGNVRAPDQTFDKEMTIPLGGLTAVVSYVGPAHSVADSLVWVPEERVLITADIVFNGLFPLVRDDLSNWTAALRTALALAPAVVVPGHGPIGDAATLRWQLDLIERLKAQVKEQYDDSVPLEEAQAADIPEVFANLPLASERWSGAVSCVYHALTRGLAEDPSNRWR